MRDLPLRRPQISHASANGPAASRPVRLLERIALAAHKRDVPYQSLIKTWLAEKVDAR
jgi:CopG antitoxin of type II toxin-antitoxin system